MKRRRSIRQRKVRPWILWLLLIATGIASDAPLAAQAILPIDSAVWANADSDGSIALSRQPWQAKVGDDPTWKLPEFDDSGWSEISVSRPLPDSIRLRLSRLDPAGPPGILWLRQHLRVDPRQPRRMLMKWYNFSAGELYVNGSLIAARGDPEAPAAATTPFSAAPFEFDLPAGDVVIALRINAAALYEVNIVREPFRLYMAPIASAHTLIASMRSASLWLGMTNGILLALGTLHLLLFVTMRHRRAHLYYAGYALVLGVGFMLNLQSYSAVTTAAQRDLWGSSMNLIGISYLFLPLFLYSTFKLRVPAYYQAVMILYAVLFLLFYTGFRTEWLPAYHALLFLSFLVAFIPLPESIRVIVGAVRRRADGARILAVGLTITAGAFAYGIWPALSQSVIREMPYWFWAVTLVALPVSSSIYLVREITRTSRGFERLSKNLEEEVAVRTEQLREARLVADEANQAKSRFLANMSHELRTPLNAIIGYSEMLVDEARDIEQETMATDLGRIHSSGKHLLGLINDVLDLSKVEAGRMDIVLDEVDVEQLVSEVSATVQPLLAKNHNVLETHVAFDTGVMLADGVKLRQILFNLLSNASKFTDNGTVRLSARRDDGLVTFEVSDTGMGMTPAQMAKLFQPFAQAESDTSRKFGGTGLGLAISRRFAELMGGTIDVSSVAGTGTTFVVTLPAATRDPVAANIGE